MNFSYLKISDKLLYGVKCNLTLIVNDEELVFSVFGVVFAFVSIQHGLLAGLYFCGNFSGIVLLCWA